MTDATPQGRIRPKDRDTIVQSLRAGVVPRVGQQHIQVGRAEEVRALVRDVERIAEGGSAIRFVIGEYGSGKTFFLNLIRSIALEKRLVTLHADLNPDRRLHATDGKARSLYAELMRNLSTRARPEGGALASVVERFVSSALTDAKSRELNPEVVIREKLAALSELVGGYDFAEVIAAYWRGHDTGNEVLKADAVKWLRGEFSTRTDARKALGVRTIIDDAEVYDQLKLLARFVRLSGYDGLMVCLDELVNLYKMANTKARASNYEQILRILNDCLQGSAEGLGFILGGTPEFLMDTRRGLYSYEALQSRLAQNTFAVGHLVDYSSPVLRLANLTPEDLYVLLTKLRHVYSAGDASAQRLPDEGLHGFMTHCSERIGEAYFRTPRSTVTAFINLLAVLEQNPGADWKELLGGVELAADVNPDLAPLGETEAGAPAAGADDELASFKL
ncbi:MULTISPECIES: ATP-binding protein [unclassified Myxococcus]|uniref:ATP-binding protein n=1 Tax=unclassified Myxococcus TaxID=2648731 RepID=UPI001CC01537|nr:MULTISPECIES: ATP-binding protein [unclassified Myxococcus]MBZ4398345.1 ATP-binding protein [Myxococcus sp. AS-1-15]MBZ4412753.1 ATP-binding protein [Myxococcus sp. XM-1-1-1]